MELYDSDLEEDGWISLMKNIILKIGPKEIKI